MKLTLSSIACLFVAVSSLDKYAFVSDQTCEAYGMESIHDAAVCEEAASHLAGTNGIRSDYKFIDVTDYKGPGRPNGCSYHRFGNVQQWHHGYDEDCTVNGFAGCFCKPVSDDKLYVWAPTTEAPSIWQPSLAPTIKPTKDVSDSELVEQVVYRSIDMVFSPPGLFGDRVIARIPFGDDMMFSMDIRVHALPSHSKFANIMFCGTSMSDRQFVVSMNENSNDPNNELEKGFRVFLPAEGPLSRINTPAIEAGKRYHLDVKFSQSTLVILQDGVVVYEDDNYSEHKTFDSIPCYIGNPDPEQKGYDAIVSVSSIVIRNFEPKQRDEWVAITKDDITSTIASNVDVKTYNDADGHLVVDGTLQARGCGSGDKINFGVLLADYFAKWRKIRYTMEFVSGSSSCWSILGNTDIAPEHGLFGLTTIDNGLSYGNWDGETRRCDNEVDNFLHVKHGNGHKGYLTVEQLRHINVEQAGIASGFSCTHIGSVVRFKDIYVNYYNGQRRRLAESRLLSANYH